MTTRAQTQIGQVTAHPTANTREIAELAEALDVIRGEMLDATAQSPAIGWKALLGNRPQSQKVTVEHSARYAIVDAPTRKPSTDIRKLLPMRHQPPGYALGDALIEWKLPASERIPE